MARYVDIESKEFVHILSNLDPRWKPMTEMTKDEYREALEELNSFAEAILALPPADVQKINRGEWVSVEDDVLFECSICDAVISTSWDYENDNMFDYCPCCGAKMKN